MLKKSYLSLVVCFLFSSFSFAQENISSVDYRIIEYLGPRLTEKIINERPSYLSYYQYLINDSFKIIKLEDIEGKSINYTEVSSIIFTNHSKSSTEFENNKILSLIENNKFNILTSNLVRAKNSYLYYLLKDTNIIIAVEGEESVLTNYKKS